MKIQKSILAIAALVLLYAFSNGGPVAVAAESVPLFTRPSEGVKSYHMDRTRPYPYGARFSDSDDVAAAISGELRQLGYVATDAVIPYTVSAESTPRDGIPIGQSGSWTVTVMFDSSLWWWFTQQSVVTLKVDELNAFEIGVPRGQVLIKTPKQSQWMDYSEYKNLVQMVNMCAWFNRAYLIAHPDIIGILLEGLSIYVNDYQFVFDAEYRGAPVPWSFAETNIEPAVIDIDSCQIHGFRLTYPVTVAHAAVDPTLHIHVSAGMETVSLPRKTVQFGSTHSFIVHAPNSTDFMKVNVGALTLSPQTVDPGDNVAVSGKAYYDNGLPVKAGTARISVQEGGTYTAPVVNGQFKQTVKAPMNRSTRNVTRTVSVVVEDGLVPASTPKTTVLTVRGQGRSSGFVFNQALMCRDAQSHDPWGYIEPTEVFGHRDSKVTVWFELADVYGAHTGETKWYRPDGTYWGSGTFSVSDAQDSGRDYWKTVRGTGQYIDLQRHLSAKNTPGMWKVEVYVNGVRQATLPFCMGYDLREHRMCRRVDEDAPWGYHQPTNTFYQTDERAYTWCQLENVAQGLWVKWVAYGPDEVLYDEWNGDIIDPVYKGFSYYSTCRLSGYLPIAGTGAAQRCGDWRIEVYVQDLLGKWAPVYTDHFRILEDPAVRPEVSVVASPDIPTALQETQFTISATDNTYLKDVTLHLKIDGQLYEYVVGSDLNRSSYEYTLSHDPFMEGQRIEYWATATDTSGNTGHSSHRSFTVKAPCSTLSVVTRPATDVEAKLTLLRGRRGVARLRGYLADDEGFACTCSFMYRHVGSDGEWNYATLPDVYRRGEHFEVTISDLMPWTTYEFAAVAWNDAGCESTGDVDRFFTGKEDPVVVTVEAIKDATSNKVILIGRIDSDGGNACTAGFMYGALEKFAIEPVWQYEYVPSEGLAYRTGDYFVATVGQWAGPYVAYYFYAVVENAAGGIGIGAEKAFSYLMFYDDIVKTLPPEIVGTTVTLNGQCIGAPADAYGFRYGLASEDPSTWSLVWAIPGGLYFVEGSFSVMLEELEPNTHYGYRAVARQGLSMIEDDHTEFFTTPVLCPAVRTDSANIVGQTVTMHGTLLDDGGESCETRFCVRLEGMGALQTEYSEWRGPYSSGMPFSDSVDIDPFLYPGVTRIFCYAEARNSVCSAAGNERSMDVVAVNSPPVLHYIGDRIVTEGSPLAFTISATDADGDPLTYSASGLPTGASFDPETRTFTWTPTNAQVGTHSVTFSVTDGRGGQDSEAIWITVIDTPPPPEDPFEIVGYNWDDEDGDDDGVMEAGEPVRLKVCLRNTSNQTLGGSIDAYLSTTDSQIDITDDRVYYDTFPPGASQWPVGWHDMDLNFSLTAPATRTGSFTLRVVYAGGQQEQELDFSKTFEADESEPPVLDPIGDKSVQQGQMLSFTITATDPDGDSLTYSASDLPSGATFSGQTFTWTPASDQAGTYDVTFTVSDGLAEDSETILITVLEDPGWQIENLIVNGDFELGNTGFDTGYTYDSDLYGTSHPWGAGDYCIGVNPADHFDGVASYGDHTSGEGYMFIANGSHISNVTVWATTVAVVPNTNYVFSYWLSSWSPASPAEMECSINGLSLGTGIAPSTTGVWTQISHTWNSGDESFAAIRLVNQNLSLGGNDFAIDDVSMVQAVGNIP